VIEYTAKRDGKAHQINHRRLARTGANGARLDVIGRGERCFLAKTREEYGELSQEQQETIYDLWTKESQ